MFLQKESMSKFLFSKNIDYSILNPPKKDMSLYETTNKIKEENILNNKKIGIIKCTLFNYDSEYVIPIELGIGNLNIDLFSNECDGWDIDHEYIMPVKIEKDKLYEIEFIVNKEKSKQLKKNILDVKFKEMHILYGL